MSLFVLTAGDELYDCLLQAVPWDFAGKDFLLNALCIITMLLINKPLLAYQFGISAQLKDSFDEIRVAREGNQTVSPAQLLAVKRFYRDAINSYLIYFGEIFDYDDLKNYADSLPGSGNSWADDFGFSRFHGVLQLVSHFCAPDHWQIPLPEASESDLKLRDRAGFCYLKIFSASFIKIVSDLLGPMPSFESLLLFMTPKALVTQEEIDELRVAYISSDHSWRMASLDEVAPGTVSFPAKHLLTSNPKTLTHLCDSRHGRLRATERLGSRLRDNIQYIVFERALKILAHAQRQEQEKPRLDEILEFRCEPTLEKDGGDEVPLDVEEGKMSVLAFERLDVVHEDNRLRPSRGRTLEFAREQQDILKILLRDKGDRLDLASLFSLQLYYERGDSEESGQTLFETEALVDLWLFALRETTKDFKALQDSLSKRKVIENEYYNQDHLNK